MGVRARARTHPSNRCISVEMDYASPMTPDTYHQHASELLDECYEALLLRSPDAYAIQDKRTRLADGSATLRQIIAEIVTSEEFLGRASALLRGRSPGSSIRLTNDMSQYGEVWLLIRRWVNAQAKCGVVVDIGAHGRERSNSYDLLRHFGWRGLLVEANPALLSAIRRDFSGCDLRVVSCAISDFTGKAILTIGTNDDVSSLNPGLAQDWGQTRGEIEVDVRRLVDVLDEHAVPHTFDLLSLDIEGEDIKVFNDLVDHSAYRPEWVIIEASFDFKVKTLEDAPFSAAVCAEYRIAMATSANLILHYQSPECNAWLAKNTV